MDVRIQFVKRKLAALLLVLAVVAGGIATVFMLTASSDASSSTLASADLTRVEGVVTTWQEACLTGWPKDEMDSKMLSADSHVAIDQAYDTLKQEVGTKEWVNGVGQNLYPSLSGQMEGLRKESPEAVFTGYDAKVLGVSFVRFEDNGDAVVRVRVWECHTGYDLAQSAGAKDTPFVYDETPIYDYRVRKVDEMTNEWKLVACSNFECSEDLDPTQSGPDTPHRNYPAAEDY
jgi:hypothetical protein